MNRELDQLVQFYETLTRDNVRAGLARVYARDAHFKDPFNEVRGIDAIEKIFTHMFEQVDQPRFVVTSKVVNGVEAFIAWDFLFRMKRFSDAPQCIRGATHISFDGDGRVVRHRDYWDAAEELYEKLPLLGSLMRWLKRAANR